MKKTFIQWFFVKTKNKNNTLTVHIFYNLQNHPTFLSDERLVNWARGRECFVGLSVLIVYGLHLIHIVVFSLSSLSSSMEYYSDLPQGQEASFFWCASRKTLSLCGTKIRSCSEIYVFFTRMKATHPHARHLLLLFSCNFLATFSVSLDAADFHRAFLYCDSWDISKF